MSRSNFGGMIAEEKQLSGSTAAGSSSFGSYFQGVASYLPSSIKKQLHIAPPAHHSFDEDHDIVLGAEFDKYETSTGEMHLCLMLSYNNGFQVWDLQHPDGKREVVSVRDPTPIKSIKFLPNPVGVEPPNSLLAGKRPLLAVISAEESTKFPRSHVKFYSLKANDYINLLRFRSPVYSIDCNQKILLVGLRDSIYGFDLITMERVLNLPCYPSPLNSSVMALGPRWLAYAANQTMTPPAAVSPQSTHNAGVATTNYVDVATDLAKEVASGLYYLGDMGRKTVSNYLYPDDMPPTNSNSNSSLQVASTEYKDTEHAGTIIIYDIKAKKNILHFRAHSQPLSVLRFDPSGTLLVTSSVDGHNFNVFQIGLSGTGSGAGAGSGAVPGTTQELTYRHLYKLVRGVTNATIQDICFSTDSKWMAVSSTRGTTHIYAINPQGGNVNVLTHVPASNRPPEMLTPHKPDLPVPLVTLTVCNRIKTPSFSTDEGSVRNVSAIGSTCRFMGISQADERLLVFAKTGYLTLYQLSPHPPTQAELDPLGLQLGISPMSEADVCRRTKWQEYRQSAKEAPEKNSSSLLSTENDMKWLSNVEISTHSPHLRLLWIGCPQFSFRTYQTTSLAPSSSSPPSSTVPDILSSSPLAVVGDDFPSGMATTSTANTNPPSMSVLFDENAMIPTKRIDIRRYEPLPFKESLDDLHSHSTGNKTQQADDLIKEGLMDAISTPMVTDVKQKNYGLLTNKSTDFLPAQPDNSRAFSSLPPITSSNTHASTSSSLFPERQSFGSSSQSDTASTIPNYYSRYNPPQTTSPVPTSPVVVSSSPILPSRIATSVPLNSTTIASTTATTTTTQSNSPQLTRNTTASPPLSPAPALYVQSPTLSTTQTISPLASNNNSPIPRSSPIVQTISPASASPSSTSPVSSPPTSTPPTYSSLLQPTPSRVIPISTASSAKGTHSPFSTSPPFPESELDDKPTVKKLAPPANTSSKKSSGEEDDDPQAPRSSKKKKKKGKKNAAAAAPEQVDEDDFVAT